MTEKDKKNAKPKLYEGDRVVARESVYTQKPLNTDAFKHRRLYTQTLLHTDAFTHRHFYTQTLLHKDPFAHRCFYTHRHFYTKTLPHTDAFTHRPFYTQHSLTRRHFYTQTLLHSNVKMKADERHLNSKPFKLIQNDSNRPPLLEEPFAQTLSGKIVPNVHKSHTKHCLLGFLQLDGWGWEEQNHPTK